MPDRLTDQDTEFFAEGRICTYTYYGEPVIVSYDPINEKCNRAFTETFIEGVPNFPLVDLEICMSQRGSQNFEGGSPVCPNRPLNKSNNCRQLGIRSLVGFEAGG